jgi:multicomponent Na+:H+ antiporter subunit A
MLGGLRKQMPITFLITLLLVLSMAGLPPMLGFIGKELIYEAKLQLPGIASLLLVFGVVSNILMVAISMLFVYRIFLGAPGKMLRSANERSPLMLVGPVILALISLFIGLFPRILGNTLIESALSAVMEESILVKLKLWHGFNNVFFLSLFTVVVGLTLFAILIRKRNIMIRWDRFNQKLFFIKPSDVFQGIIDGFTRFSKRKTEYLIHGYHRYYILTIFLFASAAIWFQVIYTWGWKPDAKLSLQPFYISGLVMVIIASTIFTILSKSRISAIVALGVIGYGISLLYLYYSAVDLAITQILAETMIVAMFVIVLQRLPKFARLSSKRTKIRDLLVALSFGSVMTIVAVKAIHLDFNHPVSDYFLENSYTGGFGKNVVNVILVDFRALDTLGEVVVLTIAAIGVSMLFTLKTRKT